jgi:X-Pro dipeptidyl-peptidase
LSPATERNASGRLYGPTYTIRPHSGLLLLRENGQLLWLVSLPWTEGRNATITDNIITRGWADPQNYRSLTESEPLVPGRFYEMTFSLQPDDQIIPKGQQIALMIFSSDRDFTLWSPPGTELTVDLEATSITLPVVGGAAALTKAIPESP